MLVRFHSKASAGVTMFADIATELLRCMGTSGMVPGALLARDVPGALRRLRQAVESSEGERIPQPGRPKQDRPADEQEDDRDAAKVNLRTRAYPLVQLLEAAAAEECAVVWEDSSKATG